MMENLKVFSSFQQKLILWLVVALFQSYPGLTKSIFFSQTPPDLASQAPCLSAEYQFFTHSNIQPVREASQDTWHGIFRDERPYLFFFQSESKSLCYKSFSIAEIQQREAVLHGNKAFLNAYRIDKHNASLPLQYKFAIKASLEGYEARGVRLGWKSSFKSIQWQISFNSWQGLRIQDIRLKANLEVKDEKHFELDAYAEQYYEENLLYEHPTDQHYDAQGSSINAQLWISLRPRWSVFLGARDAFGSIHWKNINYGRIRGSSQRTRVAGHLKPAISGKEIQSSYRYSIPLKLHTMIHTLLHQSQKYQWNIEIAADHYDGHTWTSLDLILQAEAHRFRSSYHLSFQSFGIGYEHTNIFLYIESDQLDLGRSYTLALQAGLKAVF